MIKKTLTTEHPSEETDEYYCGIGFLLSSQYIESSFVALTYRRILLNLDPDAKGPKKRHIKREENGVRCKYRCEGISRDCSYHFLK